MRAAKFVEDPVLDQERDEIANPCILEMGDVVADPLPNAKPVHLGMSGGYSFHDLVQRVSSLGFSGHQPTVRVGGCAVKVPGRRSPGESHNAAGFTSVAGAPRGACSCHWPLLPGQVRGAAHPSPRSPPPCSHPRRPVARRQRPTRPLYAV